MIAKPISIEGTGESGWGGKAGGRAWKAVELITGDLLRVTESLIASMTNGHPACCCYVSDLAIFVSHGRVM